MSPLKKRELRCVPMGVAAAILEASRRPDLQTVTLAALVKSDLEFSNFLLGCATLVMLDKPSLTLEECLTEFGVSAVKNYAITYSLIQQHGTGPCGGFNYQRFWSEALLRCCLVYQPLVGENGPEVHELASWALLCRIGALELATAYPFETTAILKVGPNERAKISLEQAFFRTDHIELTEEILRLWGLPDRLAEAVICRDGNDKLTNFALHQVDHARVCLQTAYRVAGDSFDGLGKIDHIESLAKTTDPYSDTTQPVMDKIQKAIRIARTCSDMLGSGCAAQFDVLLRTEHAALVDDLSRRQLKILIVEDDPISRKLLQTWLSVDTGHTLITATNGAEALELAQKSHPQIIITDWSMPVMDGIRFCRALRSSDWGKEIYVLMVTMSSERDDLVQAFEAGVDDFIAKPLNRQALGARLMAAWRYVNLRFGWRDEINRISKMNTRLELQNRQLQLDSLIDPLTNIANRRGGKRALNQAMALALRYSDHFCVIKFDFDFSKIIMRESGRKLADEALQLMIATINQILRTEDTLCRWAGDQLLLITPYLELHEGVAAGQRVLNSLANHQMFLELNPMEVKVSAGVSAWDLESKTKEELLNEAEQALQAAKQSETSCVGVFSADAVEVV